MRNIKVSILIPIYNAEKYIEKCLNSVLEQTYDNIEYIILNDATPDNSMSIVERVIKQYPLRSQSIVIFENKQNQGISYTRNKLIDLSTGEYIYFVDSDDYIVPEAIKLFVKTVQEENYPDIIRCNYYIFNNSETQAIIRNEKKEKTDYIFDCLSQESGITALWLLFIRKRLFTEFKLSFPKGINGCEDFIMTIMLFYYANKVIEIPNPLYYYRLDNNISITHNMEAFRSDYCKAVEEISVFLYNNNILNQYKEQMLKLMFISKQDYLINKKIRNINKYINTFPESNSCYRLFNYSIKENLLFYLAEHKQLYLLKFLLLFNI